MAELDTSKLEQILKSTHTRDYNKYVEENSKSMIGMSNDFTEEIHRILLEKRISQRELFTRAGLSESYGYKLLSGQKTTRKRDVILRVLIASECTLEQTQRMLRKYGLPELYAKVNRDALLMMGINEKKTIAQINALLLKNKLEKLEETGEE